MDLYNEGKVERALAGFIPMQDIAEEMVVLLKTMESKLRTEA